MKKFSIVILITMLTGCSTTAGFVRGIGEDVKAGADWTASKIKPN